MFWKFNLWRKSTDTGSNRGKTAAPSPVNTKLGEYAHLSQEILDFIMADNDKHLIEQANK